MPSEFVMSFRLGLPRKFTLETGSCPRKHPFSKFRNVKSHLVSLGSKPFSIVCKVGSSVFKVISFQVTTLFTSKLLSISASKVSAAAKKD